MNDDFVDEIKSLSWVPKAYGLYPSVMIAQAILETGWGEKLSGTFNCFGRKYKPGHDPEGKFTMHVTTEEIPDKPLSDDGIDGWRHLYDSVWEKSLAFKDYNCFEDCVRDYAERIATHPAYAAAAEAARNNDYYGYVKAVAAKWATDSKYLDKLFRLIRQENLEVYDGD